MSQSFFKVLHHSKKSKARLGEIHTAHGVIITPSFVPVATKGTLKGILPSTIKDIGTQVAFVNTYHLVTHPGADIIQKAGGIHKYSKLQIPLMSDSGGFQVFSLGIQNSKIKSQNDNSKFKNNTRIAHILQSDTNRSEDPILMKLSDDGAIFRSTYNGQTVEFTPEKSINYQMKIGADMMMAFDECTYYPATHKYAEKAMKRTHEWLKRCIYYKNTKFESRNSKQIQKYNDQNQKRFKNYNFNNSDIVSDFGFRASDLGLDKYLYGIIQGGVYEDLRKISAEFVCSQGVDGIAIGGVSVHETKQEMRNEVAWCAPYLPKDRPVHLLGVGQFDDILDLIEYGIDTFDCVEPTRLARMGKIYINSKFKSQKSKLQFKIQKNESIDILKTRYKNDLSKVDDNCNCYVCKNFTKSYLHHLFKQRELLGYTLATYHNLFIVERFFEKIRERIEKNML
jgi:queuine tRNA-ribosyltransferase